MEKYRVPWHELTLLLINAAALVWVTFAPTQELLRPICILIIIIDALTVVGLLIDPNKLRSRLTNGD